jgi:glyoxylase-like metal-dependent hydrolase (beta-lactamase superfamily II)
MGEHKTIRYSGTNYYLLRAKGGYLLIDAGWNGKMSVFLKKMYEAGIDPREVNYIMVTHHHHDHAALVNELRTIMGAKLILHKKQVDLLKNGNTETAKTKQYNLSLKLLDRALRLFIRLSYPPIFTKDKDIVIGDDGREVLKEIGINGVIVDTPGHSEDSITLITDDGKAYCGDAAMNICGIKPYPIEAEDYIVVKESWARIISSGAKILFPSHGKEFSVDELR